MRYVLFFYVIVIHKLDALLEHWIIFSEYTLKKKKNQAASMSR